MKLIFFENNQAAVKEITLARMGPIWPHAGQGDFLNSSLIVFKKKSSS